MNDSTLRIVTGVFLIVSGLWLIVPFELLRRSFEYPDILRKPTGEILRKYHAGGNRLTILWLFFALSAVLIFPTALLLHEVIANASRGRAIPYLGIATLFGILAGIFNLLGLIRWVFLVPLLAAKYVDPNSSQATRDATETVFEAFHTYLGVTVGEFLGFSTLSIWGALVGFALMDAALLNPILALVGVILSIGIFLGNLEFAGWKPAGAIVAISSGLFAVWLIVIGTVLLF
ncbi:MAG TPA: DUF4386 domain-containing protein [Chloroflexia bacterium]|nr:DUF4386 domain-containing protein [Chloroflexia bacterium]